MNIIKKLTIYSFLLLIPTNAYAAPTDNLSENKVQIVADANGINPELLDKTGFPIKEVADKAERVSGKLALDLLKAKMIIEVYIDTRSNYMLLITEGGAVMLANYEPDPKLLDKLFENKITPVFGEFLAFVASALKNCERSRLLRFFCMLGYSTLRKVLNNDIF